MSAVTFNGVYIIVEVSFFIGIGLLEHYRRSRNAGDRVFL